MSDYHINNDVLKKLEKAQERALHKTGQAVLTDIVQRQVMPFDTGEMQNNRTVVDASQIKSGEVVIRTTAPQARRLYYHPEYNFQRGKNANAGGRWFDDYAAGGGRSRFVQNTFTEMMRRELGS